MYNFVIRFPTEHSLRLIGVAGFLSGLIILEGTASSPNSPFLCRLDIHVVENESVTFVGVFVIRDKLCTCHC